MAADQPVAERGLLRIGELSRRHGLTPDVLRAWERRYGLLRPERSPGGFRLYTASDDERVRAMRRNMSRGFSPAVAARMALRDAPAPPTDGPARLASARMELGDALESYRDVEAQGVLDGLLAAFSVETVVRDVVLPYLHDLGERWAAGEVSVAQEHFASEVIRGRLLGLARGWDTGTGPRALLAWRVGGTPAPARAPCWPARPTSTTTSGSSASASGSASTAGGSPTSAPTAPSPRCGTPRRRSTRA